MLCSNGCCCCAVICCSPTKPADVLKTNSSSCAAHGARLQCRQYMSPNGMHAVTLACFPCRQSPRRKQQQRRRRAGNLQDQPLLRKAQLADQQATAALTYLRSSGQLQDSNAQAARTQQQPPAAEGSRHWQQSQVVCGQSSRCVLGL
jgi:hypothetical protein